jgi:hemolysin activation/secretion protein
MNIQGAPKGAEKVSFRLHSVKLTGVTVFTPEELRQLYANKVGTIVTLADVYGIAADLTRKYRNDGYILTQVVVPPQTIEGGNVRLQVVEGYIDSVQVQDSGDSARASSLIRAYASTVRTDGGALNVSQLERALLLINDLPGVTARGILSPSAKHLGAADLTIIVERKAYDALVAFDNYGSRYLGPEQLTLAGSLNSALGMNERITAQAVEAPDVHPMDPEMLYTGIDYQQPIGNLGTVLEIMANQSLTDPGFDLDQFDVDGRSRYAGIRVMHPLIRSRGLNLAIRATFDMRNVTTSNNIEEDRRNDRIRALRLGAHFDMTDTFLGAGYNVIDLEISHGLDVLGASDESNLNVSRPGAERDFLKYEAEIQRLQKVYGKLNALFAVSGQYTDDPLYSSEEFGVGGVAYGRGYDPSEIIGDKGVAGKFELQWNSPWEISYIDKYQLVGFYDAGHIWNLDATTSKLKQDTVTSTGGGFRADITPSTTGGLLIAFPLDRNVQTRDNSKAPKIYFSLSHKF